MQVAIRHPKLVRKLVIASGFFSRDGAAPGFWQGIDQLQLQQMPKELRDSYRAVAPHPENLQLFFDKGVARMRTFKDIPPETIRSIQSPALIVVGDQDVVRPEHAVEEYRLIVGSRLAVLPGTDHMSVTSRTAWLTPMINEFLDGPIP